MTKIVLPLPSELEAALRRFRALKPIVDLDDPFKLAVDRVMERLPPVTAPLGGPLECEVWFGGLLRAALDARTASNEWLALQASLYGLDLEASDVETQRQAIADQELPQMLNTQTQLDLQLAQMEALVYARTAHRDRMMAIVVQRSNDKKKADAANKAVAFIGFDRDVPGFATKSSDYFKEFQPEGKMLDGAMAATEYLLSVAEVERGARDDDEILATNDQIAQITQSIAQLRQSIENLTTERQAVEVRLELIEARASLVAARKNDWQIDWDRRVAGVAARYLRATERLERAAAGLARSIEDVHSEDPPTKLLKWLLASVEFSEEDRGSGLDEVELVITSLQQWFDAISSVTHRRKFATRAELVKSADGVSVLAEISIDLPEEAFKLVRCRGLRCYLPAQIDPLLCDVSIAPPSHVKNLGPGGGLRVQEAKKFALGMTELKRPEDEAFYGVRETWNLNPYGEWKIFLSNVLGPAELAGQTLQFELLLDHTQ